MKKKDYCPKAVKISGKLEAQQVGLNQKVSGMLNHTLNCSDCEEIYRDTQYYKLLISGVWYSREELERFVYTMEVEEPLYPKDFEALSIDEITKIIQNFRLRQAYWEKAEEALSNN